jgi:hypothetical protein
MSNLAVLLEGAKKTKFEYWVEGDRTCKVYENLLAAQLAEHIEKQMVYEAELTKRIMYLEEEQGKYAEANKVLQEYCDTLRDEICRLQGDIGELNRRNNQAEEWIRNHRRD